MSVSNYGSTCATIETVLVYVLACVALSACPLKSHEQFTWPLHYRTWPAASPSSSARSLSRNSSVLLCRPL